MSNKKQRKYYAWKKNHKGFYNKGRKHYIIKLVISSFIMILIYLWYKGHLTFFAQPTAYTNGIVTDLRPWRTTPYGRPYSLYIQYATYTYDVDGSTYKESFHPTKKNGRLHEGDTVKIQYSLFFNSLSKVIEVVHCVHDEK